jgi:phospholipid/cholesterol/gamma-HCH transport system ATP-binding protein
LYDEPTAGLDPVTSARILGLIAALHARLGGVSIVISNEMDTLLKTVPRVVMLHRGLVVFDGDRSKLDDPAAPELARRFVAGDVTAPL